MIMQAEELRIRHRYRALILMGKLALSLEAAKKLVGPDCAYRLYARVRMDGRNGQRRAGAFTSRRTSRGRRPGNRNAPPCRS